MIEQTIQRNIDLINNNISGFSLSLHKQNGKGKLMISDHFTHLCTPLMIDKLSEIDKGLHKVICNSESFGYSLDNLLLYLKQ